MSYVYLAIAIIGEVIGTTLLKVSEGFSKIGIGLLSLVCYGICFVALSWALKGINLSIAYAMWSGIGIIVTALIGALIWHEAVTSVQLIGLALIIVGVVVVNLVK